MLQVRWKGRSSVPLHKEKKIKYNDDKSMKTTSSRAIVNNFANDVKNMSRASTTFNTQLQILKEARFNLSDSKD